MPELRTHGVAPSVFYVAIVSGIVCAAAAAGVVVALHVFDRCPSPARDVRAPACAVTVAKQVPTFIEHFCPLAQATDAESPIAGWSRYQDASSCFTIDYPKGWRVEADAAAVHLWSAANPHRDDGTYWAADVVIVKPHGVGDDRVTYDALVQKGWKDGGRGMLVGPWSATTAGDGSALNTRAQEWQAFTGRGAFQISLTDDPNVGVSEDVLEKIAGTFVAQ